MGNEAYLEARKLGEVPLELKHRMYYDIDSKVLKETTIEKWISERECNCGKKELREI